LLAAAAVLALRRRWTALRDRARAPTPRRHCAALFAASTATWWQQGVGFEVTRPHPMDAGRGACLRFLDAGPRRAMFRQRTPAGVAWSSRYRWGLPPPTTSPSRWCCGLLIVALARRA
jgi:hypothetical protein